VKSCARLAAVALALSALPGCHPDGPSVGALGRAQLAYLSSSATPCSLAGVGLDRPMMADGAEPVCILPIGGATLPSLLTLTTSDASVVEPSPGGLPGEMQASGGGIFGPIPAERSLLATLRSHARGVATFSLVDSTSGDVFDAFTVRVEGAQSLVLDVEGTTDVSDVEVAAGQQVSFEPRVLGDAGDELAAWHSVHATVADPGVAAVSDDLDEDDSVAQSITGASPGATTMTLQVGPVRRAFPVTVR
jgi:hypothetical protein